MKLAVTVRLPFIARVVCLLLPEASPLQELNELAGIEFTVSVTEVPGAYFPSAPGDGLAVTVPPPARLTFKESVKFVWLSLGLTTARLF